MPATSVLAGISSEATQIEVLSTVAMLLVEMLDRMPRTDGNKRVLTAGNEVTSAVTISSGTVTTCSTLTNQVNIGGRDASIIPHAVANIGTINIYNNIIVS